MITDALLATLREGFVGEAEEIVQALLRDLLALERAEAAAAPKLREQVARGLHTFKGSAATVGLDEAARLAHRLEDWLGHVGERPTSAALDVILPALDVLLAHVRASVASPNAPVMLEQTLSEVVSLTRPLSKAAAPVTPKAVEPEPKIIEPRLEEPRTEESRESWRVRPQDVQALVREVERLRELRLRLEERRRGLAIVVDALASMQGVGRLHGQLVQLAGALEVDVAELSEVVTGTESVVKAVGTVPVDTLAEPLRRAAREVAKDLGKEVRLSVAGGDGAVERRVLESLRGALVQLVRNAVVHGVEQPEERTRRGKHREGALVVRFEQQGNLLEVSVEDDGAGIDLSRVREAARSLGRVGVDELGDDAASELIFEPGLTTAESITAASGRGVGLDVVRSQVTGLGGRIAVRTAAGQGTRFTALVPVEIGASALVVVRAGEQRIGLPVAAVAGLSRAIASELHHVRGRTHAMVRGHLHPVERLAALLGLQSPGAPAPGQPLVQVHAGERDFVIAVDELIGDEELVIRPLPVQLRSIAAYQGAATLADGRLLLVVRPEWLADQSASSGRVSQQQRILVVDDSLTARALHRTVLESGGFIVHCVGSGAHALDQLAAASYDAVVCDIGMEGMDGIELTTRLRSSAATRTVPIILVSAHDADAERIRGMQAGADAFLSKRDCVSGRLIAEVQQAVGRRRASA
jgi:two-component system chemotaxis sensor kinase CheA